MRLWYANAGAGVDNRGFYRLISQEVRNKVTTRTIWRNLDASDHDSCIAIHPYLHRTARIVYLTACRNLIKRYEKPWLFCMFVCSVFQTCSHKLRGRPKCIRMQKFNFSTSTAQQKPWKVATLQFDIRAICLLVDSGFNSRILRCINAHAEDVGTKNRAKSPL